ncbi:MAG: biotin--[acetyl-CoA-carboxylase] ligase [Cyanophyceae cyanobacterium]
MCELKARFSSAFKQVQEASSSVVDSPKLHVPELHVFDAIPSTNQTLWERVEQGSKPGAVAIALEQKSGRGQWGRSWNSPPGGLYLSWYIAPKLPVENAAQLTLCATWGVARVLRDCGLPVKIKWLNDLVIGHKKLGGILTETRLKGSVIDRAVVGVGINWSNPVPDTGINIKDAILDAVPQSNKLGWNADKIDSLETLAALVWWGLERAYHQWKAKGVTSFLADYLELLSHLYCPVSVGDRCGVVVGVNAKGELRVRLEEGDSDNNQDPKKDDKEISLPPGSISLGYAWNGDRPAKSRG